MRGTTLPMRVVPILLAALVDLVGAGQVLSSMRQPGRVRTTERGAVGSGEDTLESFRACVQRLRATPNAALSLRAVLGYIERASAHPRSKICMWDPEFCNHVAPTPEARECLLVAGFVALETNDASSTPYLAQRRVPPRVLRAMALELKRQSSALEGGGGSGGGAAPAPPPNASSAVAKPQSEKRAKPTSADAALRREAERLGTGAPTAVAEAEQVEQIMGMITGIIKELERQVCCTILGTRLTPPHYMPPHHMPPHHMRSRHHLTTHLFATRHTSLHHTPPRSRAHTRRPRAPRPWTKPTALGRYRAAPCAMRLRVRCSWARTTAPPPRARPPCTSGSTAPPPFRASLRAAGCLSCQAGGEEAATRRRTATCPRSSAS